MIYKNYKCRQCRNNFKKDVKNYGEYESCKYDPLIDVDKKFSERWIQVRDLDFHQKCPFFRYNKKEE